MITCSKQSSYKKERLTTDHGICFFVVHGVYPCCFGPVMRQDIKVGHAVLKQRIKQGGTGVPLSPQRAYAQ